MTSTWDAALQPVRDALLAEARADAEATLHAARQDGHRVLMAAQREADAVLADARAQGSQDATSLLATERARSRRAARAIVLAAQQAAYDELREHAAVAVRQLLSDPANRARLEALASRRLGDRVTVRSAPDGGLLAVASDGRSVDASIHALVDGALAGLDLEQLWAP